MLLKGICCCFRPNRSGWRLDRDMGLMNAIGLQPRHPTPSVTSQGTQTPIIQLQNAETQTERDLSEPSVSQSAPSMETLQHLIVPDPIPHHVMYTVVVTLYVLYLKLKRFQRMTNRQSWQLALGTHKSEHRAAGSGRLCPRQILCLTTQTADVVHQQPEVLVRNNLWKMLNSQLSFSFKTIPTD